MIDFQKAAATLKFAKAFEKHWTDKGVPPVETERLALVYAASRLIKSGCSRDLLLEYLEAALQMTEHLKSR